MLSSDLMCKYFNFCICRTQKIVNKDGKGSGKGAPFRREILSFFAISEGVVCYLKIRGWFEQLSRNYNATFQKIRMRNYAIHRNFSHISLITNIYRVYAICEHKQYSVCVTKSQPVFCIMLLLTDISFNLCMKYVRYYPPTTFYQSILALI